MRKSITFSFFFLAEMGFHNINTAIQQDLVKCNKLLLVDAQFSFRCLTNFQMQHGLLSLQHTFLPYSVFRLCSHQFSSENLNVNASQCIFSNLCFEQQHTVYSSYISSGNIRPAVDFDFRDSWLLIMGVSQFAVTRANRY